MSRDKTNIVFSLYFVFILLSLLMSNIIGRGSIIMHMGYFISLLYLFLSFGSKLGHVDKKIFVYGLLIGFSGLLSLFTHCEHAFDSLRSIGLNINIVVPILYSIIIGINKRKKIPVETIDNILSNYSIISMVIVFIVLIVNFSSLNRILSIETNAYAVALKGFFPNKNMFGDFVAMGSVISVYIFSKKRTKLSLCAMLLMYGMTVISFSRAALLFLTVFTVLYVGIGIKDDNSLIGKSNTKMLRRMFFILVIILALLFIVNPSLRVFVIKKVLRINVGDAGRTMRHIEGMDLIKNGGMIETLFGYGISELEFRNPEDLHSTMQNVFLTGGLFKTLLFMYGLWLSLVNIIHMKRSLLSRFCLCCLVSYIVFSFFETVIYFESGFFSYEILFTILFIPLCVDRREFNLDEEAD